MLPVVELFGVLDAIRLQYVGERHHTEHDARVRPTHYGKNLVSGVPHSRQRSAQRVVVVSVGQLRVSLAVRSARYLHEAGNRHLRSPLVHCGRDVTRAHHSDEAEVVGNGPRFQNAVFHALGGIADLHLRIERLGRFANRGVHAEYLSPRAVRAGRKMQPILMRERLVDRFFLELLRDVIGDEIRNHQWNYDRIVARHLEDHDYRCERRPDDPRERRTHSDQCIRPWSRGRCGKEQVRHRAHRCPHHRSDEQTRAEYSAGIARCVRDRGADDLEHRQHDDDFENYITIENSFNLIVADAEHLRHEKAEDTDGESTGNGLNPERGARQFRKSRAHPEQKLDEPYGAESSDDPKHYIRAELSGADEMISRNVEERVVTENEVEDQPRCSRRKNSGPKDGRVQIADDFLEREEHGRNRSVECGSERGGSAAGNQSPNLESAQPETLRDDGRESRSHVNRGPLASERNSGGQRNHAADEFSRDRSQRDAAVVNEERRTGLRNATPAREREVLEVEISGKERAECGDEDSSPTGSARRVHERRETPGEKNERDDDESDECANHQTEKEREAVLFFADVLDHPDQARRQGGNLYGWHFLKLNASTPCQSV